MKTLNKQLLSTAGLMIALCGLTSFNPLSDHYSDRGSIDLSSDAPTLSSTAAAVNNIAANAGDRANAVDSDSSTDDSAPAAAPAAQAGRPKGPPPQRGPVKGAPPRAVDREQNNTRNGCKQDFKGNYTKDDSAITILPGACDDTAISFTTHGHVVVVTAVKKDHVGGRYDKGSGDVSVTYKIVNDRNSETEGKLSDCKDCRAELAELSRPKTISVTAIDLNKIQNEFLQGGDTIRAIEKAITDSVEDKIEHVADRVKEKEESSCREEKYSEAMSCYKKKFLHLKKGSEAYDDAMDDLSGFVEDLALGEKTRPSQFAAVKKLAKGNREITHMIEEAQAFRTLEDKRSEYDAHISANSEQMHAIDQQLGYMGCSGVQAQVNSYCVMLGTQKLELGVKIKDDVAGYQHLLRNSILAKSPKSDSLGQELKANLADMYADFIAPYEGLIATDPSLGSLDTQLVMPTTTNKNANSMTGMNNQNRALLNSPNNNNAYTNVNPQMLNTFSANTPNQYRAQSASPISSQNWRPQGYTN